MRGKEREGERVGCAMTEFGDGRYGNFVTGSVISFFIT